MNYLIYLSFLLFSFPVISKTVIGIEGFGVKESMVLKGYISNNLTNELSTNLFVASDTYTKKYIIREVNEYNILAYGLGLQYEFSNSFYFDLHAFNANVKFKKTFSTGSNVYNYDDSIWIGLSMGYKLYIYESLFFNVVYDISGPINDIDLNVNDSASSCEQISRDGYCIQSFDLQSQFRIGMAYMF
ncbi:hypothetical protein [Vibrio cholerae]|uniref:hypothetical protein n=1 Tax=Vibrio cholerae TaxID=666 RepID=UPI001583A0BE|nr:hypothetical protein [Vibrio cholerae]ELI1752148.1 hypothetical protein [Vibrio cholerae]ELJ8538355.1 hypothetical protein [Vibrio cholerae]ELJ8579377.1 hypothetical protein [Vibrio cholerae]MDV2372621.1 hypothetical protein [Vibrio cholerae]QKV01885.1 hypothetical protein HPY13_16845 [Vibrio cholerae]